MMSVFQNSPLPGVLATALKPWQKIDWDTNIQQHIYRDWGLYYAGKQREITAQHYYNEALELDPTDTTTLYHLCKSKRRNAQTQSALEDSRKAATMLHQIYDKQSAAINLETCAALYELNRFEDCKVELHNNVRTLTGSKVKPFERALMVVMENIQDTLGDALYSFFMDNNRMVMEVQANNVAKSKSDDRPLWKILKDQELCDVLSTLEVKEELLSPLELARRRRAFIAYNQNYTQAWKDIVFLTDLYQHPNYMLAQCPQSSAYVRALSSMETKALRKFMKMLQSRSPQYFLKHQRASNRSLTEKHNEAFLFRVQNQTRRDMFRALKTIAKLRASANLKQLTEIVEEVMGNYVVLKTNRIMPWKFEFMNDVYNTLALAYTEQYVVPERFSITKKNALLQLLLLPEEKPFDVVKFVFGDRKTHTNLDTFQVAIKSKLRVLRLEKRLIFAKYDIEKSYLHHQIADLHLQQCRYDECSYVANKAILAAKNCNSNIWCFLSYLLMAKSYAALHRVEKTSEIFFKALDIAKDLKSFTLLRFVETCILCNESELHNKKQTMGSRLSAVSGMSKASSGSEYTSYRDPFGESI